jgi:hypothetical protein
LPRCGEAGFARALRTDLAPEACRVEARRGARQRRFVLVRSRSPELRLRGRARRLRLRLGVGKAENARVAGEPLAVRACRRMTRQDALERARERLVCQRRRRDARGERDSGEEARGAQ